VHDPTTGIPREVSSLRPDELVEERDSFATGDGDVIPAPGPPRDPHEVAGVREEVPDVVGPVGNW
jgi:hypothetical protein